MRVRRAENTLIPGNYVRARTRTGTANKRARPKKYYNRHAIAIRAFVVASIILPVPRGYLSLLKWYDLMIDYNRDNFFFIICKYSFICYIFLSGCMYI